MTDSPKNLTHPRQAASARVTPRHPRQPSWVGQRVGPAGRVGRGRDGGSRRTEGLCPTPGDRGLEFGARGLVCKIKDLKRRVWSSGGPPRPSVPEGLRV